MVAEFKGATSGNVIDAKARAHLPGLETARSCTGGRRRASRTHLA
jgi:hypothetical protein